MSKHLKVSKIREERTSPEEVLKCKWKDFSMSNYSSLKYVYVWPN